jgi:hypothetical protein
MSEASTPSPVARNLPQNDATTVASSTSSSSTTPTIPPNSISTPQPTSNVASQTAPNPTTNPATAIPPTANATALAEGLLSMLSPVVQDCDERIHAVLESQIELATQIDFLTAGILQESYFLL